ncbi:MAG: asparagine synthase (glutamine-hydrolyzing) [Polyangiaceae bacterium]
MCGIAGLVDMGVSTPEDELRAAGEAMTRSLSHRGPDDQGVWVDAAKGVSLGHRRLSIVDLSQAGHQPMVSANGRFVITYNGEIYNHDATRKELQALGASFRGASDTEVILEACAAWSVQSTLPKMNGMFAFAIWDRKECVLTLVRDRLGIKPLYWAKLGRLFLFGSELKALRAHRGWSPKVRPEAISAYMRHAYIPGPHTIYEGVQKLEPGTVLTLRTRDGSEPRCDRFWDLSRVEELGRSARSRPDRGAESRDLVDELDVLLRDAVSRRMVADVPLGAFLSGGVDSSTVAALMQAQSTAPIKTYTIGLEQDRFDEAPHARAVAKHLGTDHTELYVSSKDALDVIPELPHWYDEPFADASQIPTLLVSRLTRKHVTVALSGDGGDELFAGYPRYFWNRKLENWFQRVPRRARSAAAWGLRALSPQWREWCIERLPAPARRVVTEGRIEKLSDVLNASNSTALYRRILSLWPNPEALVLGGGEARGRLWESNLTEGMDPLIEAPQFLDTLTYLPDDILTKVDRASMAVGLEARVPLIDYRVVEFSWRLPMSMKIRDGRGKWILRQVLDRYVPKHLIDRPKMGFGIPIGEWLRGPLRDWAEDLLSESTLDQHGLLQSQLVRRTWKEHLSGRHERADQLWAILMLQAWLRVWA